MPTLAEVKNALELLKDLNDGENDDLTTILQPSIDIMEKLIIQLS